MSEINDRINYSEEMRVSSDNTLRVSGFVTPPKYVGGYRIDDNGAHYTQFNFTRKPIWLHRAMARVLLGWEWRDGV